jgi:hypothetical protein
MSPCKHLPCDLGKPIVVRRQRIIFSMQRFVSILIIGAIGFFALSQAGLLNQFTSSGSTSDHLIQDAFENHLSDLQVTGSGQVTRLLSDDNDGSRHQRFILKTSTGQTLLVAHNIDLAQKVSSLGEGDRVEFNGEYEWNSKGGVIHWTHHDPQGTHTPGWLKHNGRTYQ